MEEGVGNNLSYPSSISFDFHVTNFIVANFYKDPNISIDLIIRRVK